MTDKNAYSLPMKRSWPKSISRGFRKKCPQCGRGSLYKGYLKPNAQCDECSLNLSGHQADDAPPYITMMIVGHLVIPLALAHRQFFDPSLTSQFAIWTPILLLATFWLLPRSKGALIGLQWAHRMHGFADNA